MKNQRANEKSKGKQGRKTHQKILEILVKGLRIKIISIAFLLFYEI